MNTQQLKQEIENRKNLIRTKTNARTRKGPRKVVSRSKKEV